MKIDVWFNILMTCLYDKILVKEKISYLAHCMIEVEY